MNISPEIRQLITYTYECDCEGYLNMITDNAKDHLVLIDWVIGKTQFSARKVTVAGLPNERYIVFKRLRLRLANPEW